MSVSAPKGYTKKGFEKVRDVFAQILETEAGGACALYIKGEKIVDLWGGYTDDVKRSKEWKQDTVVNAFSCSKGVTGLCILLLVNRGLLSLDDLVTKHWPEFGANNKEGLTVAQLLSHQAGLIYFDRPPFTVAELLKSTPADQSKEVPEERKSLVSLLSQQKPQWELTPGRHGYHAITIGFYTSELVRRVDPKHRNVGTFFREEVLPTLSDPSWLTDPSNSESLRDFHFGVSSDFDEERIANIYWNFGQAVPTDLKLGEISDLLSVEGLQGSTPKDLSGLRLRRFNNRVQLAPKQFAAMRDPTSNFFRSIFIIKEFTPVTGKSLELPSAIGFTNGPTLAALYSRFADGSLVSQDVLNQATTKCSYGPDLVLMGTSKFSKAGFSLLPEDVEEDDHDHQLPNVEYRQSVFCHTGAGGTLGWGDHQLGLGFSFVTNTLREEGVNPKPARSVRLINAVYQCLAENQ